MARAGLDTASVVAEGADLADEIGFANLTMGRLAERVGVRTPSLYKHVTGQDDLVRRIAALSAAARALRDFVVAHPGRYTATIGLEPTGPDDMTRALRALRSAFHGFATIESAGGFQWSADTDESFDWLVDLIDTGLRAKPAG